MRKTFTGSGMLSRQGANCISVRMLLGAESAQLRFLTLANGRLRDRSDQDLLGGSVKPGRRQSADDLFPDARLGDIELGRRRWSLAREDRRYHRQRDAGFAATRHRRCSSLPRLGFDF
jgi:hypothetical protein